MRSASASLVVAEQGDEVVLPSGSISNAYGNQSGNRFSTMKSTNTLILGES